MKRLTDALKDIYHGTTDRIYQAFWRGKEVHHEPIVYKMSRLDVTFSDLNAYLSKNLEERTIRFPKILENGELIKKIAETVDLFYNNPKTEELSNNQKKERLIRLIAMDVADAYRVTMRTPKDLISL